MQSPLFPPWGNAAHDTEALSCLHGCGKIPHRVWQNVSVEPSDATREELEATIAQLRAELERLREEIRLLRHDRHEVPPHY